MAPAQTSPPQPPSQAVQAEDTAQEVKSGLPPADGEVFEPEVKDAADIEAAAECGDTDISDMSMSDYLVELEAEQDALLQSLGRPAVQKDHAYRAIAKQNRQAKRQRKLEQAAREATEKASGVSEDSVKWLPMTKDGFERFSSQAFGQTPGAVGAIGNSAEPTSSTTLKR